MRSRYSAYALGLVDYILETQASDDRAGVERFAREASFTGLKIHLASEDEVEFTASYTAGGQAYQLHERSRFERRDGRWIYLDGVTPRRVSARVGRNDPCPCGSGQKYKKCCGA